jgi:hypothetical protein
VALSGTVIAGLALIPAASAATTTPARSTSKPAGVTPDVGDCHTYTDNETYAEGYCAQGPGDFFTYLVCNFGTSLKTIDGPTRVAGGGRTSYAHCPVNWTYWSSGTIPAN